MTQTEVSASPSPAVPVASTASSSTKPSEKEAKEQKSFERWRRTISLITGVGLTPEEFRQEIEKADRKQCELRKEKLIKNSPGVRFMMNNLVKAGCPLTEKMVECAPCDKTKSGGFSKDYGILLCQNGFFSKTHQEHTMIHEMIHMYDHCAFNVDWDNIRHHACSEVRAAALSGDCNWSREVRRGFYTFTKQHQECVKRRAIISVVANPKCPSHAAAERAVNAVFESCYNDTRPFDEFY
ncbi:metalloprotease ATP23 [Gamsiella multidivaricata]|uniref:metalloprotease ATP23 n=1 Tax=Gamsiella multidivaricata TaxID=101098 RepID=UPI00221EC96E|nr:metalloprotease ATP23 [Gamsiella multidivaricata]KAG0357833.1 Mitochondrial inner membrane protease atp23 [Gamsiella multidivaricata]KAI7832563.1 metalloprotease ATP23 [Gamsiella multidivaricata]